MKKTDDIAYIGSNVALTGSGKLFTETKLPSSSFTSVGAKEEDADQHVALWGDDNLLPDHISDDIEKTPVLSSAVEAKARIAIGKGPMPAKIKGFNENGYEQLEFVNIPEINEFLEANNSFEHSFSTFKDFFGWGNSFTQFLLSSDRKKIVALKREIVTECRLEKMQNKRIKNVLINADWARGIGGDNLVKVPLLDRSFPLWDLQARTSGHNFMLHLHYPLYGRKYYSQPGWYPSKPWVEIAQEIPALKKIAFRNSITIKQVIDIHPEFWKEFDPKYDGGTPVEKKKIREAFYASFDEHMTGTDKAYKSVKSIMVLDAIAKKHVPAITVTPIQDNLKDGKLLPDSVAANREILLGMMINSALLGVDMPGGSGGIGAGSGSNIREAFLVQIMMQEPERQKVASVYNLIKQYNGWDKDIVWRYPNQILTTLNTGKNTETTA